MTAALNRSGAQARRAVVLGQHHHHPSFWMWSAAAALVLGWTSSNHRVAAAAAAVPERMHLSASLRQALATGGSSSSSLYQAPLIPLDISQGPVDEKEDGTTATVTERVDQTMTLQAAAQKHASTAAAGSIAFVVRRPG